MMPGPVAYADGPNLLDSSHKNVGLARQTDGARSDRPTTPSLIPICLTLCDRAVIPDPGSSKSRQARRRVQGAGPLRKPGGRHVGDRPTRQVPPFGYVKRRGPDRNWPDVNVLLCLLRNHTLRVRGGSARSPWRLF